MCNLSSKHPRRLKLTSKLMSIKLKEILTKNGPYPTPLNPISSQAKADPGLAPAMFPLIYFDFPLLIPRELVPHGNHFSSIWTNLL